MNIKICPKCTQEKEVSDFTKDKYSKDGLCRICRTCRSENRKVEYAVNAEHYKTKVRAWAHANADLVKENAKRKRERPEYNARMRDYLKQYRIENKRRLSEYFRNFYIKHKPKRDAYTKEYNRRKPESKRAAYHRRKSSFSDGTVTAKFIRFLLSAQKGCCASCKKRMRLKFHVDHIEALSKGGKNTSTNIQLLCPRCNIFKSAKDPVIFMQSMGYLI